MNTVAFINDQARYFDGSYEQFCAFGGPCVYFHRECLRAAEMEFLSERHLEMLYATLTAWGMHRMGSSEITKTKLTEWTGFRSSILDRRDILEPLRALDVRQLTKAEYVGVLLSLREYWQNLRVSTSASTLVANSKALFHLLPTLIPPIDRQYTIRFFEYAPERWRGANGKFRTIVLPTGADAQFALFCSVCQRVKDLVDQVDGALLHREFMLHGVTAPKAIDNAIVNFIRLNSGGEIPAV